MERSIEITQGNFKALAADFYEAEKSKKRTTKKRAATATHDNVTSKRAKFEDQVTEPRTRSQRRKSMNVSSDICETTMFGSDENPEIEKKNPRNRSSAKNRASDEIDGCKLLEENWKDKNVDAKPTNDENHLSTRVHRSSRSILSVETDGCVPIPILLNGGRSRSVEEIPVISTVQTCSFDAIFQLVVSFYADSQQFKGAVDSDGSYYAKFLRMAMESDPKKRHIVDAMRNMILTQMFPEKVEDIGEMKFLDCETFITTTFERLCEQFPLLFSMLKQRECCEDFIELPYVRFRLNKLPVGDLQRTMYPLKAKERCDWCKRISEATQTPLFFLTFDTDGGVSDINLADIQTHVKAGSSNYTLLGIVELIIHLNNR